MALRLTEFRKPKGQPVTVAEVAAGDAKQSEAETSEEEAEAASAAALDKKQQTFLDMIHDDNDTTRMSLQDKKK